VARSVFKREAMVMALTPLVLAALALVLALVMPTLLRVLRH
jgi:hypothetical protein